MDHYHPGGVAGHSHNSHTTTIPLRNTTRQRTGLARVMNDYPLDQLLLEALLRLGSGPGWNTWFHGIMTMIETTSPRTMPTMSSSSADDAVQLSGHDSSQGNSQSSSLLNARRVGTTIQSWDDQQLRGSYRHPSTESVHRALRQASQGLQDLEEARPTDELLDYPQIDNDNTVANLLRVP